MKRVKIFSIVMLIFTTGFGIASIVLRAIEYKEIEPMKITLFRGVSQFCIFAILVISMIVTNTKLILLLNLNKTS